MRVELLGPLRVLTDDGVPVPLPTARRERAVLSILALRTPSNVHIGELVSGIWGDEPPRAAAKNVQTYISALRKALPDGAIETTPSGYRLHLTRLSTDIGCFEDAVLAGMRAVQAGEPTHAIRLLNGALETWRGEPLLEINDQAVGMAEAARLAELRRAGEEALIDARLDAGEHAAIIGDLEAAVAAEPLREKRWAQLMLALYRCGRQAEALRAFQRLTTTLSEELGIAPSRELRELEEAILLQDQKLEQRPSLGPSLRTEEGLPSVGEPDSRPLDQSVEERPQRGGQPHHQRLPQSNLPTPLSSFIGRTEELDQILQLMQGTRLLTLTGVGGAGKTRLAVRLASLISAGAHDEIRNGIWFADLAPLADEHFVPQAIADALGFRPESDRPVLDHLSEYLHDRHLLLVIDNCEHVIDAVAETVERLLAHAPNLKILATSRQPLQINGEIVREVRPLDTPAVLDEAHIEGILSCDSVALFVDRSHARCPDLDLSGDLLTIGRIVRRLDGLPLAIELAAGRISTLSPGEILAGLDDRFRVLTGGSRTALERQKTLEATLDWSYRLLEAREKVLFARASVFVGSFTMDALRWVASGDPFESPTEISDGIEGLVAKSLLTTSRDYGPPRFRFLETVRVYAEECLGPTDRAEQTKMLGLSHADYYIELAEAAEKELVGPHQAQTLASLKLDQDNIRAAIGYLLADRGLLDKARELFGALARYWFVTAQPSESIAFAQSLLDFDLATGSTVSRIRALRAGAWASVLERPPLAWEWCHETLRISLEIGDDALAAEVTSMLAAISIFMGEPDPSLGGRAVELAEKISDPVITGMAHLGCGLAVAPSDSVKARQLFEQGLEATAESGDRLIEYLLLGAVGELCYAAGEKAQARQRYEGALNLAHELGYPNPLYQANLGLLMLDEGDVLGAVAHLRDCLRAGRHSTVQQSLAPVTDLAHCAVILGAGALAAQMYGFADHMAAGKGLTFVEMDDLRRGDYEEMKRVLGDEGLSSELEQGASLVWDDVIDLADEFAQEAMRSNSTL